MRLKITLEYLGTAYAGWQLQPDTKTVQGALEDAASATAGEPVRVHGASRTDAGVHALGQVAHFDVPDRLDPTTWAQALNARLPRDVRVVTAHPVDAGFHARHNAVGKTYRYRIDNRRVASPFRTATAWHVAEAIDRDALRTAARYLQGPVDQRAFSTQPIDRGRPLRPIDEVSVAVDDDLIELTFAGRSFLRYAVRGMVGTLVEAGLGRRAPESLRALAESGDREQAGATAPPHGLFLCRVRYPQPDEASGDG